MRRYCAGAARFLEAAWDDSRALFSYSTTLVEGGYAQVYAHPKAVRYTVNSLLGLQKAKQHDTDGDPFIGATDGLFERFVSVHGTELPSLADTGLLTVALSERGDDAANRTVRQLAAAVADGKAERLTLQDVSWMLWGLCEAARRGVTGSEAAARSLFRVLHGRFLNRDSLLGRHSANPLRSHVVSFGATVYWLRALYEYASTFDDEYVDALFRFSTRRVLEIQGPLGQWPWMIAVASAQPVDPYPVFSVHQDSMSMLFLLPALDRGVDGVEEAIDLSLAWLVGDNELEFDMIVPEPFFVYRSFERQESLGKARRYARSLWRSAAGRPSGYGGGGGLRVNSECRSYQLGWILYAWSGRSDLPDLDSLRHQPRRSRISGSPDVSGV